MPRWPVGKRSGESTAFLAWLKREAVPAPSRDRAADSDTWEQACDERVRGSKHRSETKDHAGEKDPMEFYLHF
jgi:hypothetical protein